MLISKTTTQTDNGDFHYIDIIDILVRGHNFAKIMIRKYENLHDVSLLPLEIIQSSVGYWMKILDVETLADLDSYIDNLSVDIKVIKWDELYNQLLEEQNKRNDEILAKYSSCYEAEFKFIKKAYGKRRLSKTERQYKLYWQDSPSQQLKRRRLDTSFLLEYFLEWTFDGKTYPVVYSLSGSSEERNIYLIHDGQFNEVPSPCYIVDQWFHSESGELINILYDRYYTIQSICHNAEF